MWYLVQSPALQIHNYLYGRLDLPMHKFLQRDTNRETMSSRWSYIAFCNPASEVKQVPILPHSHWWSNCRYIPRFKGMDQSPHLSREDYQYHLIKIALVWNSYWCAHDRKMQFAEDMLATLPLNLALMDTLDLNQRNVIVKRRIT